MAWPLVEELFFCGFPKRKEGGGGCLFDLVNIIMGAEIVHRIKKDRKSKQRTENQEFKQNQIKSNEFKRTHPYYN